MSNEAKTNNPAATPQKGQAAPGTGEAGDKETQDTPLTKEQVEELLKETPFKSIKELVKGHKNLQAKALKDSKRVKQIETEQRQKVQEGKDQEDLIRKVGEKEQERSFKEAFAKGPETAFRWLREHDSALVAQMQRQIHPLSIQQKILDSKVTYGKELTDNEEEIAAVIEEYGLANAKDPIKAALKIMRGDKYGGDESEAKKRIKRELELEEERKKAEMASETTGRPGEKDEGKEEIDRIFKAGPKKLPF